MNLEGTIIEDLIDSEFTPGEHEAYAWVMDEVFSKSKECSRLHSEFHAQLKSVNWENVEREVRRLKEEISSVGA